MLSFNPSDRPWNEVIAGLHDPHILQSWEWASVKEMYGWTPMPFVWHESGGSNNLVAAAMILKRTIPIAGFAARMCILYIPKGPVLDWHKESLRDRVIHDLEKFSRSQGAIFLKMDPDIVLGRGVPGDQTDERENPGKKVVSELKQRSWVFSKDQIQFRNSILLDLAASEEDILSRMKQKTRYNIRLAARKGVKVRFGNSDDLSMLYKMYAETSFRDGFVIRSFNYYHSAWGNFLKSNGSTDSPNKPVCEPLIAEVDGEPVAALILYYFSQKAYYLYGMSRDVHRDKMPNYLLQWEAIRRAREAGCSTYDLWGAPENFDSSDSMWGVYRFKEGLGGEVVRTLGAWDYAPNQFLYGAYTVIIPRILNVLRNRGKTTTKRIIEA